MRVNSVFKVFLTSRLVLRFGITLVMPAIFFITSSFTEHPTRDLRAKQVNLIIRLIGHRLLLQAGDTTSRVLPVTEINEGTFLLGFENEFVFNHDSLMILTQRLLPKTQFPSGYTVTVHECANSRIVYGFQMNNTSPDILACRGRAQPPGCYSIEIAFSDLYENVEQKKVEQKKADVDQLTEEPKSVKVDPKEAHPFPIAIGTEELKPATLEYDIDLLTEELRTVKVDLQEANSKLAEIKPATFDYPFISLVCSGMLALLSVALLIERFGKNLVPVPVQHQDRAVIRTSIPKLPALGRFLFDVKDQRLLLGTEVITLTDKECRILELLNKSFGELISRETLMQKIWINEGIITGRSLDMFVSKLRKKLSGDPELRITNVHGKGYKLEISGAHC